MRIRFTQACRAYIDPGQPPQNWAEGDEVERIEGHGLQNLASLVASGRAEVVGAAPPEAPAAVRQTQAANRRTAR